jgi:hypothetical protein
MNRLLPQGLPRSPMRDCAGKLLMESHGDVAG